MRENRISIVAIVCGVILLLAAGYFAITMTMEKVSEPEKNYLVVGTNTPFPPFELKNGDRVAAPRVIAEKGRFKMPRHEIVSMAWLISEGNTCHPSSLYFYNNAICNFLRDALNQEYAHKKIREKGLEAIKKATSQKPEKKKGGKGYCQKNQKTDSGQENKRGGKTRSACL